MSRCRGRVWSFVVAVLFLAAPPLFAASGQYRASVLADNPAAYYPLDETSGLVAEDISGNGNDGTYFNVLLGNGGALGSSTTSPAFDGGSSYVQLPGTWGGVSSMTIEAWVWIDNTAGTQAIVASTAPNFIHLQAGSGFNEFYIDGGSGQNLSPVPDTPINTWRHVALVITPGGSKLYVDGSQTASNVSPFTTIDSSSDVRIGMGQNPGRYLNGRIDEVAIYNTALSPARILAHYNAQADGPLTSAATGNWSSPATWVGGLVPTSLDDVVIDTGHTVTIDSASLMVNSLTVLGTLDLSSFGLTVANNVTVANTINGTGDLTLTGTTGSQLLGLGTINAPVVFDSGSREIPGGESPDLTGAVSVEGIVLNNGEVTLTDANGLTGTGTWNQGSTGTLHVEGAITVTNFGASAPGNTVDFTGSFQPVRATTYHHLIASGDFEIRTLAGPITVNGDMTVEGSFHDDGQQITGGGSGTLTLDNFAELYIGTYTGPNSGNGTSLPLFATYTFDPGSDVLYRALASQTVSSTPFYGHLSVEAANTGGTYTKTANGTINVAGTLSVYEFVSDVVFDLNTFSLNIAGDLDGAGVINTTGVVTLEGTNLSFTGTITPSYSITFAGGNPQSIRGTLYDALTINKSGNTAVLAGAATATFLTLTAGELSDGNFVLTSNGTVNLGAGTTLRISATMPLGTQITDPASTVVYEGDGNQTISTQPVYGNLVLTTNNTNAIKTPDGATLYAANITLGSTGTGTVTLDLSGKTGDIEGNLSGTGDVSINLGALNIGGNLTFSGAFDTTSSNVTFDGIGAQLVRGAAYEDMTIDKTSGTATLAGNASVSDELFILDGTLNLGSYALDSQDVVLVDTPGTLELNTGILKIAAYLILDGALDPGTTGELWSTATSWPAELSGASTAAVTIHTLRITDAAGLELDAFSGFDLTVTNLVDLSGGGTVKIETPRKMTIGTSGSINRVSGAIQGTLAMQIPAGQTRRFETATYTSNTYSPIEITSSNAATINVLVTDESATQKVDRFWNLSGDPSTLDLKYEWAYSGYVGDTRGFVPARFFSSAWTFPAGYVEMSGAPSYFAQVDGVSAYEGDWTAANAGFLGEIVPSIGSFDPAIGAVGTGVVLYGSNFTGATAVSFNGTPDPGFSVSNDNELYATVPAGATTGTISVTNPSGTGTSFNNFTVASPSTIQTQAVGEWSDTATWQGGVVPSSWDNVVINHNVTMDVAATINDVQLNANLDGSEELHVDGTMTWNSGIISSDLYIDTGATLDLATVASHVFSEGAIQNDGTINVNTTTLYLATGADLDNSGTINIAGDFDIVWNAAGTAPSLDNMASGEIVKTAGSGTSSLGGAIVLNSTGTIRAEAGTLDITSAITTNGIILGEARTGGGRRITINPAVATNFYFEVANGATLEFSTGAIFQNGSVFSGTGTILVSSAVEFNGDVSVTASNFVINANALITWDAADLYGTINWAQGSFTGALNNAAGSVINAVTGAGTRTLNLITFTNQGTLNLATAAVIITNGTTVTNDSGADINIQGDYDFAWDNVAVTPFLQNNGTITKTAGSGTSSVGGGATFASTDTLRANSGTLRVTSSGIVSGAVDAANASTTVEFNTVPGFADEITFSGLGTVLVNSGATFTGDVYQTAGLFRIDTVGAITMTGVTFNGHVEWKDATISGDSLIIAGGSVWTVATGTQVPNFDTISVVNQGTFNLAGESVALANGATFNNQLTLDIQGDYDFRWNSVGAEPSIGNTGTIKKSSGTSTSVLGNGASVTNNGGTIQADSGTLSIASNITSNGVITAASGATILFPSGAIFNDFTDFTGAGTIDINSNATFAGGIDALATLTKVRGAANTMTFNAATVTGTLTWKEASFAGTGLTIPAGSTLALVTGTGTAKLDGGSLTVAGDLTVDAHLPMRNGASFTLASGGTVSLNGDYNLGYDGTGALPAVGLSGAFTKSAGAGTSSVSCGGVCTSTATGNVSALTGTLDFTSGLTSNGTITFDINGPVQGTDFGLIAVTGGTLTLTGTATALVDAGYVPDGGTAFQVMTYTAVSGDFTTKSYTFAGIRSLIDTYSGSDLVLTASGPTISSLAPSTGAAGGGTSVVITGTGFTGTTPNENFTGSVKFDGVNAPTVTWQSATQLTATTPAGTGTVDVNVTNVNGETHTATNAFTFSAGTPPTITALSVSAGTTGGGTYVEISGTDLAGVTQVQFGPSNATILSTSPILKVRTPAGTGTVNVTVTSPDGSDTLNSSYTYAAPLCDVGASGVVSWYRAEGDVTDGAGGNDGTLAGTPSFTSAKIGQGVVLDSDDDAVTIPHTTQLDVDAAGFTVEFWMQGIHNQPGAQFLVVDKSHGWVDSTGWAMQGFGGTGILHFLIGRGGPGSVDFADVATTDDVLDGQLHHIAGVWDGTNLTIYVDGLAQNSTALGGTPANNTRPVNVGYSWGGGTAQRFYRGIVDELTVHNRGLSAAEVLAIYDADTAGKCYPAIPTVHSISPASGTTAGGTAVTIEGSSMSGASVTIGNSISIGTNTQSQITGTTVATGAGTYNVNVSTGAGTGQLLNGYTFAAAASYTSVTSGNWTNPATWGSASYPQPGDSATVNHDVTVNANVSVANLTVNGTGTRLSGTSTLTVTGTMTWNGGDIVAPLTLDTGSTTSITGSVARYIQGGITNDGTVNFDATGAFTLHTSDFTNNGTFNITGDVTWLRFGAPTFFNTSTGQFNKTGGSGISSWAGTFTNDGTMTVNAGTLNFTEGYGNNNVANVGTGAMLRLSGSGTSGGTFATGPGTGTVEYDAGNHIYFGSFTGSGKLRVTGGVFNQGGGGTVTNFVLTGGTTDNAGVMTISGSFLWTGGDLSAPLILGASSNTSITGAASRVIADFVTNNGTVTQDATGTITVNSGSFTNNNVFDLQSDGAWVRFNFPLFTNTGQFTKSGGTGTATWDIAFTNSGTFNLNSGSMTFTESFSNSNVVNLGNGILNVNSGGTCGGTFATGLGSGIVELSAAATTFSGTVTGSGKLRVSGGAVDITGTPSVSNFELTGGAIQNSGTLTAVNSFVWSGGDINAPMSLPNTSATSITGAAARMIQAAITNDGTVTHDATGTVTLHTGNFTNNGDYLLQSDGAMVRFNTPTFTNSASGQFSKNGGLGTATWDVTFVNDGQMDLNSGSMTFTEPFTSTNVVNFGFGATLTLASGGSLANSLVTTNALDAVDLSGGATTYSAVLTGPGALKISGATVTISGATAATTNLDLTGGSIDGGGTLTVDNTFDWTGGSTTGSTGSLTLGGTCVSTISGPTALTMGRIFNNQGTITYTATGGLTIHTANFNNSGTVDLQVDGGWSRFNTPTVVNTGTIQKTAGAGGFTMGVNVDNSGGTIDAASGFINFTQTHTANATSHYKFAIAGDSTFGFLNFSGGAPALSGAQLTAYIAGVYSPAGGLTWTVMSPVSGTFGTTNTSFGTGRSFAVDYPGANSVRLTASGPTIASVTPASGSELGGETVVIAGTGFTNSPAPTVTFGTTNAASVTFDSATQLTVVTPAHIAGAVNVNVTNSSGEGATLTNGFIFTSTPAPIISAIRPATGNVIGGTTVHIDGANLDTVTTVTFDGIAATIQSQTATLLEVLAPPHAAGSVPVVVTNPSGSPSTTFTYVDSWDVARDFSRSFNPAGPWSYGSTPTLGGAFTAFTTTSQPSGLDQWDVSGANPSVLHNATASPVTHAGDVIVPAGSFGLHPSSPDRAVVRWTAPSAGQWQIAGSFTGIDQSPTTVDAAILVGGTQQYSTVIATYGTPHAFNLQRTLAAGEVVEFTVGENGSSTNDATGLTATITPLTGPAVTITAISPASGRTAGGQSVTITGTNFHAGAGVTFGGATATSVTVVNVNTITATTPAHAAGTVDVVVTHGDSADATLTNGYVYSDAGVSISKSAPANVAASAVFSYSITVSNAGPNAATGVTVSDVIQAAMSASNVSAPSFTCSGTGTLTCTAATLAVGTHTITFDVTAPGTAQTITNVANLSALNDTTSGDNSASAVTVVGGSTADLSVTTTASAGSVAVGGSFTWTSTVTNNGPSPATTVTLTNDVPAGQTITAHTPSTGSCNVTGNSVACNFGTLASGASANVVITVTADDGGTWMNAATVDAAEADGNATNDLATASVTVTGATSLTVINNSPTGNGSLAQAITDANAGVCTAPCTIVFAMQGSTVIPAALPAVTANQLTIDATTQTGYTAGAPVVALDGTAQNPGTHGLIVQGANGIIKGFSISGYTDGIRLLGASNTVTENLIYNNTTGVSVVTATANEIVGNSIHSSAGMPIDHDGDGVAETNDAGDSDGGSNNHQNAPVIASVELTPSDLDVTVSVDSSSILATNSILVEVFRADTGGEPQTFLGSQCFAGRSLVNQLINLPIGTIVNGNPIVATATSYTDGGCANTGDGTSEVSAAVTVGNCVPPAVAITGPSSVCAGGSVTLDAGAHSTYLWTPGNFTSQTISVTPGSTTTYNVTVTDASGCANSTSHVVTVNTPAPATITPGGPTTFCTGGSVVLTASLGSTYLWSPGGQTSQSITVTAAGNYSVTVTDGNGCQSTSAATTVTVNPAPSVTITGPAATCNGSSVTLTATAGFTSYLWQPGNLTGASITVTPTADTTYTVTADNGGSCTASDTHLVTVNTPTPATITPAGPTTFCTGGSVVLTANAGSTYLWSPGGQTSQSITVTAAGSYSVTVTDGNGCPSTSASTTVTVNPAPTVTITGPAATCNGTSVTLNATAGFTNYLWQPGNLTGASITVAPTADTTYTVTADNGGSCTASDTHIVTVNTATPATITPTGPTTFCTGGSVVLSANPGSTYLWSPGGQTSQSITVTAAGNYSVTVTDGNGCPSTSASTTVTVNPSPVVTITGPGTSCESASVTLTATAGFTSYLWQPGNLTGQSITVNPASTTTYTVTADNGSACTATDTHTVTVTSTPAVGITGPASSCAGAPVTLSATAGFTGYLWQPGNLTGQTITVSPTANTTYTVTATAAGGCTGTATHTVTVNPVPVATATAAGPTTFCAGGSVVLNASAGASYQWLPNGETSPSISVTAGGTYSVIVTDGNGCSATSNSITVTVNPAPSVTITGPSATCDATPVTLDAGPGFASYLWQPGNLTSQTITVTPASTTNYSVTVTNGSGCTATDTHTVTVSSNPVANVTAPAAVCSGTTGHSASVGTQPGATYAWSITNGTITGGTGTPAITFQPTGLASVQLNVTVTAGSCTSTGSATVQVSQAPSTPAITAPANVPAATSGHVASITPQAGASYVWSIDGGTINGSANGSAITFSSGNTSPISLSVTVNVNGCLASASANVVVDNALPPAEEADLSVTKSAPATVTAGSTFDYTISVANAGPAAAVNLALIDTLPAGITVVNVNSGAWSCGAPGGLFQCSLPALAAGSFSSITLTVQAPTQAATIVNSVSVSSAVADPLSFNDADSVTTNVVVAPPACPAAAPSLLSPANGATVTSPVALSWSAVAGATAYDVWVTTEGTMTLAGATADTSMTVSVGSGVTTWYVVAHGGNGCDPLASLSRSFTVQPSSTCGNTAKPQVTAPTGTVASSPVTFSWTPVPQAIGYRVWISVDGTALQDVGSTGGAISLTAAVPPGASVVFVDALFNGCPPSRSEGHAFFVSTPDPCAGRTAPVLTAPANNSQVNSSSVELRWSPSAVVHGVAPEYRVWASVDGGAPEVRGTTTETSFRDVFTRGQITWYVQALYPGCPAIESARFTFNIPARDNCGTSRPTLVSPSGTTVTAGNVHFVWSGTGDASGYEVYLGLGNESPTLVGTTSTPSFDYIVPEGSLTWFVRALFDRCPARDSQPASFTYTPPPACAVNDRAQLIAPLDGPPVASPVDLSWSAPEGAARYELYVQRPGETPSLIASTNTAGATNVVLENGAYEWFVRTFFTGCSPLDSSTERIHVVSIPAACAPMIPPAISAPGQISSGAEFLIQWTPIPGATSYQLQLASNAGFSDAEILNASATQHTLVRTNSGNAPQGVYARVRAIDSRCAPTPSVTPYGPVSAVFILPQAGSEGSATLANKPDVKFTIHLGPELAAQTFAATPNQPWLTVTPASGVVPNGGINLVVTADTGDLAVGTNLGAVNVTLGTADSRVSTQGFTTVTSPISVNLVTPVTPAPKNSPPPDALVIPAVANAAGINSKFQSDVRVSNTSAQLMKYQLTYTPSGETGIAAGRQTTFSIEPGRTVALDDILKSWFGTGTESSTGMLEVRPLTTTATSTSSLPVGALANLATFASSRTFNVTPNGTFGQHIPAIPFANFIGKSSNALRPTLLSLQQIAQSAKYRTNVGVVEGSGEAANLMVRVFGSSGAKLVEFPVALKGGQHMQMNGILAQRGVDNLSDGRIEVEVVSGTGKITAYASVLDNDTSDPLLVSPVTLGDAGTNKWVVPGVADLNNGTANWQTDLRVFNAGTTDVEATLSFYSQNGGAPKTANLTIPAGQVRILDKTLSNTFGASNDGGAVHISTPTDARLIATARTYNQTTQGTYGQFISAVTPAEAAGVGTRPLQLLQVEESTRFRSNIGLAEVTGNPVKLELTIVPPDAKFVAVAEVQLAANEFRQIGSLLRSVGLGDTYNARVTVRAIEGTGRVAAYASVIDAQTNDPTYVPAQ